MAWQRRQFPFLEFEPKWQKHWIETGAFACADPGKEGFVDGRPKFYVLDMFPYPSGDGLHVGHVEGYTATDIVARAKRMQGFNVLHPMGWDAFGLPAEQFAIKTGRHPRETTNANITRFRSQLQALGFSYDWSREISTTHPEYFRWTQWIFLQLYESWFNPETRRAEPITTYTGQDPDSARLAYVAEMPVNWCPELGTVLANEEIVDGKSEVGGFPVERRPLRQWMLRITAFAERLLEGLEGLDWPEGVKLLQRNWIGRSEGALVQFAVEGQSATIEVFTTRPDTLFGATYMVLAPEHPLVDSLTTDSQQESVANYRRKIASKSDLERTELSKEKSGVPTGALAINPVNGEKIPVWIADYVLMGYGTGGIMAVPAHDERDFEFAQAFGLSIREVVSSGADKDTHCFSGEGVAINSGFLDGLPTAEAKSKMIAWLEDQNVGKGTVNFKLRDWLFSRQRYWGEPFPILWEEGQHRPVAESELPVVQPDMEDFKPTGSPEPPLGKALEWVQVSDKARRETNTMPQWAGSCWYYLRFCDPRNKKAFVGTEQEAYWMGRGGASEGVDLYVGGTEHAVLHLLYARFWHKVLHDLGHVSSQEPFAKLVNQGIILGPDGVKMSKSRGNVVTPDTVIEDYGADSLRLYEMFMGPLEQMKPWSMKGVEGVHRFLARVWRLAMKENQEGDWIVNDELQEIEPTTNQERVIHQTIKKVTGDIENMAFNTAIAQLMVCTNEFVNASPKPLPCIRILLTLLSPFAPHLCDELWEKLGGRFAQFEGSASSQTWPTHDPSKLEDREIDIIVQVNGKLKDRIRIAKDLSKEEITSVALAAEKIRETIADKEIKKIIVVPAKLVNFVV